MSKYRKLMIWVAAALALQGSIYLYLDRVLLAPTSSYQVFAAEETGVVSGKAYYSRDRRYMAIVKEDVVEIYTMPGKTPIRTVELGHHKVSYFKWLEDRDLALMGLHSDASSGGATAVLAQVRPVSDGHELSATIKSLPKGAKITDVAYSTATNVIYMQVLVGSNPDRYRMYRTDANHDLKRVYLQTDRIGRIAVLYDHDAMFYDNLTDGTVIVREGDGSWRHISPYPDKYRLVGVDAKNNIYIARLNKEGLADQILKGRLKVGFELFRVLQTPRDVTHLKVSDFAEQHAK